MYNIKYIRARKESVAKVAGKRNNASGKRILHYRCNVTFEAMMKRPRSTRCTTGTFRRANRYVKFIRAVFTIVWHLSIIDTRSPSLFSFFLPVIGAFYSDLPFHFPLPPLPFRVHIHHRHSHTILENASYK